MQFLNVRLGHATSSSSLHNVAFLPRGVKVADSSGINIRGHNQEGPATGHDDDEWDFGWQFFTAASDRQKLRYLGVMLRDRIYHQLPQDIADILMDAFGVHCGEEDHIDHQSFLWLPSSFGSTLPDLEFFKELKAFFIKDNLVILGGNDNIDQSHPLCDGTEFRLPLPGEGGILGELQQHYQDNVVCRKDEENDYWTLYDQVTGAKARIRFTDRPQALERLPHKSAFPELVDIKITNRCDRQCKYCYTDSTPDGEHADREGYSLWSLANTLGDMAVFEAVIGGGEPTLHPSFMGFLEQLKENGVTPNFTTRSLHWLKDHKMWSRILDSARAFGYSVSTPEEITELSKLLEVNGIDRKRVMIHLVMGTMNRDEFDRLMRTAYEHKLSVVLLGYKVVGRGRNFTPLPYDWWLEVLTSHEKWIPGFDMKTSVDTILAAQYEEQLKDFGLPAWMFEVQEGEHSCYVDAVRKTIGPHSYCDESEMLDMRPTEQENEELPWQNRDAYIFKDRFNRLSSVSS